MIGTFRLRCFHVERRACFCAGNHREAGTWLELGMKYCSEEMIFTSIQPALIFFWLIASPVPFMPRITRSRGALQIKWSGIIKRQNHHAFFDWFHLHVPVARMRGRMEIAIVHQRLQVHFHRRTGPQQLVLNIGGVFTLPHPHALFQQRIGQRIGPHWLRTFQTKTLYVLKPFRIKRAAGPAMSDQRIVRTCVVRDLIQSGQQLRPSHGWLQRRDQQSVIPPRHAARYRPGGKSSNPIRHQPFAGFRCGNLPANLPAELNFSFGNRVLSILAAPGTLAALNPRFCRLSHRFANLTLYRLLLFSHLVIKCLS